jgi:hypothetical protein
VSQGAVKMEQDIVVIAPRGNTLILAGLATSMAVNILGTGLIVFKIFKVLLEYEPTSVKGTLDWLKKNGGDRLLHILFIIIESGMALFAIQLVRIVLTSTGPVVGMDLVIGIHEMLNQIASLILRFQTRGVLLHQENNTLIQIIQ